MLNYKEREVVEKFCKERLNEKPYDDICVDLVKLIEEINDGVFVNDQS